MNSRPPEVIVGACFAALISFLGSVTALLIQAGDSLANVSVVALLVAFLTAVTNALKDYYAIRFRQGTSKVLGREKYDPSDHFPPKEDRP